MQANLFPDRRAVDDHVHVFVQADGEDESAVLGVVRGQVRAAAAERDTERSPGDDHGRILIYDLEHARNRGRANAPRREQSDRKSTRLNSSHEWIARMPS